MGIFKLVGLGGESIVGFVNVSYYEGFKPKSPPKKPAVKRKPSTNRKATTKTNKGVKHNDK